MALAEQPITIILRGAWPGRVTLRRGWSRAEARPWNSTEPRASLRLVRGSPQFLEACTYRLGRLGVADVISPPLPLAARRTWELAGFEPYVDLALMRRSLDDSPRSPNHLVVERPGIPIEDLLEIDAAAFPEFWRFDEHGLTEAIEATTRSCTLGILDGDGRPVAYAVVGFGSAISYLQRVAVHPDWQGQGMGRSLVRASARKARAAGARVLLLNTQLDNEPAINLYVDEDFVRLPESLTLLHRSLGSDGP